MGDRFTTLPELLFDGSFTRTTDAQISFATLDTVRFTRTVCIHEIHVMFAPTFPPPIPQRRCSPSLTLPISPAAT